MSRRNLEEIQTSLLTKKEEVASLSALEVLTTQEKNTTPNLNSNSKVAIWRLWIWIQAFAIWLHEGVFETHVQEINELILLNKIHTSNWYREKGKEFQYGFSLGESDIYDNTGVDESLVIASKIIDQISVQEVAGRLKIKVAKRDAAGALVSLEPSELTAFIQYMQLIKDAGTRLDVFSKEADDLRLVLDIHFDPLVFNSNGERLDGQDNEPVLNAIQGFLYNLEFDGELILMKLGNSLETVEGVEIFDIEEAYTKFAAYGYSQMNETYISESGYMLLDVDNTVINYISRGL